MANYEVQVKRNGQWSIESFHDDLDPAMAEVARLRKLYPEVRVSLETFDDSTGTFRSKVIGATFGRGDARHDKQEALWRRRVRRHTQARADALGRATRGGAITLARLGYYTLAAILMTIGLIGLLRF